MKTYSCGRSLFPFFALPVLFGASCASIPSAKAQSVTVKLVQDNGAFHLLREGKPYFVKGGGGDASKQLLHDIGGNSFRTWGADNLDAQLNAAQKLGLTVTIGIWLGHKEHGFNYSNPDQVAEQYEQAKAAVMKYRNHPALLLWAVGNEMEGDDKDSGGIWSAVNNIASMIKKLDPNHPTMTVVAELGGEKVKHIHRLCPDVDIIGINSYGGGPSLAKRYKEAGGTKPYLVTEYGPPGTWETGKDGAGVVPELTSTEKAERYRTTYKETIAGQPLCLGSYAFTWGSKQEATATWFGMLLSDGARLGAVDAMQELWSGKPAANKCPNLNSLQRVGEEQVEPGAKAGATLDVNDPEGDALTVKWVLQRDADTHGTGGDTEPAPPTYPDAIVSADLKHAELKMPTISGTYRLFAFVHDTHGGAAVANVPFVVKGGDAAPAAAAHKAKLPVIVYAQGKFNYAAYTPSGYMGNAGAIKMNEQSIVQPHSGKVCLQIDFKGRNDWGGVVWQDPPNDWGDHAGGQDLTGAAKLSFWARGEKGGEVVTFLCGIINSDKTYFDTAQTKLDKIALTKDWKQYTIDLKGRNLTRIKTGFGWTLAAGDAPVTFYLDDVKFE